MTTKHSPLKVLKAQANKIAATLKAAERGEPMDVRFAEKHREARAKDSFKVGVVMDDKVITLEMPWTTIQSTTEPALAEYILGLMREARDAVH
jgi:hypothetical protein